MSRNFGLSRSPTYRIEGRFGVMGGVSAEDADWYGATVPDAKIYPERARLAGWVYIPLMVLLVSVLIIGLRILFGG